MVWDGVRAAREQKGQGHGTAARARGVSFPRGPTAARARGGRDSGQYQKSPTLSCRHWLGGVIGGNLRRCLQSAIAADGTVRKMVVNTFTHSLIPIPVLPLKRYINASPITRAGHRATGCPTAGPMATSATIDLISPSTSAARRVFVQALCNLSIQWIRPSQVV